MFIAEMHPFSRKLPGKQKFSLFAKIEKKRFRFNPTAEFVGIYTVH
jgi:hypothetical protein